MKRKHGRKLIISKLHHNCILVINTDLTQFTSVLQNRNLQELQNAFTSRAENWDSPSRNKKEDADVCVMSKAKSDAEASRVRTQPNIQRYELGYMYFSKGKTSLCSIFQCTLYSKIQCIYRLKILQQSSASQQHCRFQHVKPHKIQQNVTCKYSIFII